MSMGSGVIPQDKDWASESKGAFLRPLLEGRGESSPKKKTLPLVRENNGKGVWKKIHCLFAILLFGPFIMQCAGPKEIGHVHADSHPMNTFSPDYLHPLTEINLEKVIEENRGLRVLEENATTVRDFYRGGVQEKAEGERLLAEGKWEEARQYFYKSTRFFQIVLDYLPGDEPYLNIYGDHTVIFLPNLLIADNYLKLVEIYAKTGMQEDIYWAKRDANKYLSLSLRSAKTEWASGIKKKLEER